MLSISCHRDLLGLLVKTTDLSEYNLLARCAQVFLRRADTDSVHHVVDACTKLFRNESPTEYIANLEKLGSNGEDAVIRSNGGEEKRETAAAEEMPSAWGFPLLINIQSLLLDDRVEEVIDIAARMERCSSFSEDDQFQAWNLVVEYLLQTGHIFLDGFPLHRPEYLKSRKLILEQSMSGSGQMGLQAFLEAYTTILERVAKLPYVTATEMEYIQRACHQSVLRLLQADRKSVV